MFNRLFFATDDAVVATLAAFASFAVGFAARPLGGIIFGHLGDRIGRRACLLITVVMIGTVTGLIGVLPGFADIGIAAPVLLTLLRLLQGVAVGGEWGGAITLAVEHAPPEKRGRYAAMPQIGSPVGTLLSSGAFLLVALLPPEDFDSWGWRLPFLAAFPLLAVALWLRRRVEESPLFDRLLAEDARASAPVREVITGRGRRCSSAPGPRCSGSAASTSRPRSSSATPPATSTCRGRWCWARRSSPPWWRSACSSSAAGSRNASGPPG